MPARVSGLLLVYIKSSFKRGTYFRLIAFYDECGAIMPMGDIPMAVLGLFEVSEPQYRFQRLDYKEVADAKRKLELAGYNVKSFPHGYSCENARGEQIFRAVETDARDGYNVRLMNKAWTSGDAKGSVAA